MLVNGAPSMPKTPSLSLSDCIDNLSQLIEIRDALSSLVEGVAHRVEVELAAYSSAIAASGPVEADYLDHSRLVARMEELGR